MPKALARSKRRARFASKKWKCEPTWMGRSPVLATTTSAVSRSWLATMSPSASRYSPGITRRRLPRPCSADGLMNGHELGAVGKSALDLHLVDHLRHAFHDVGAPED